MIEFDNKKIEILEADNTDPDPISTVEAQGVDISSPEQISESIIDELKIHSPIRAFALSQKVGITKKLLNSFLYGSLRGSVQKNGIFEWSLK